MLLSTGASWESVEKAKKKKSDKPQVCLELALDLNLREQVPQLEFEFDCKCGFVTQSFLSDWIWYQYFK